ncbi:hypothetical protein BS47DRAFT_181720 [Hydnum rufescens UP504]|uniref:Uncharacterized protein n=1 Tax=Hydnum rufescens UP504 TaxID=1448309 RepID=A0A9P6ANG2_9AGAM|nr:hypothetical protein BS47DRAFT_181720 [Hydnum rufescens UP504]
MKDPPGHSPIVVLPAIIMGRPTCGHRRDGKRKTRPRGPEEAHLPVLVLCLRPCMPRPSLGFSLILSIPLHHRATSGRTDSSHRSLSTRPGCPMARRFPTSRASICTPRPHGLRRCRLLRRMMVGPQSLHATLRDCPRELWLSCVVLILGQTHLCLRRGRLQGFYVGISLLAPM